jgi:general stress protein 26
MRMPKASCTLRDSTGWVCESHPTRADSGLIWFVTDARSDKEHEIEAAHDVCLVFIDAKAKRYLSITARAACSRCLAHINPLFRRERDP